MGWEVGGRFKREGTHIYLWLIHVDIWHKPTRYCKAIILQLKKNFFNYNEVSLHQPEWLSSKNLQTINTGQGLEKRESSYTIGENVN